MHIRIEIMAIFVKLTFKGGLENRLLWSLDKHCTIAKRNEKVEEESTNEKIASIIPRRKGRWGWNDS